MSRPKTHREPKPCRQCGTLFGPGVTAKERGRFKKQKFCSMRCMWDSYKKDPAQSAAAFLSRIDKSAGQEACWPYTGAITTHGYGCTNHLGRVLGAHKVAWILTNGPVPAGLCVLHKCDNPPCCNPAHLFLGTKLENAQDKSAKGRAPKTAKRKLTAEKVREIRSLRGKATSGEIAAKYGIDQSYTFAIWGGKVWRDVT